MAQLLGPDGNPIKPAQITQAYAEATVGGVRNPRRAGVAKGLDPVKWARIMKAADDGNNDDFLTLAEEMEEREQHYASVLGQRKRAISLIEPIVSGDTQNDVITDAVQELVAAPAFAELVDDLVDGIAKGYSVADIEWQTTESAWTPIAYHWRDPRYFQFDPETGSELRIKDEKIKEGVEIPPYAMIVHRPKLKSGLTVRGGLARLVSWCFMLKSFTLQDWAAFLEVFGMPLRVGKYDRDAKPEEKATLLRAVRDLGSDAAAIIPEGMLIEFIEAKGGQGNAVFGDMAEYLDKQTSKAVLGQTMTTDEGSSLSQAQVHEDVKIDIKKSDARQLGTTINRDLIRPYVAFNFGPQAPAPVVTFPVPDPEDVQGLGEVLSKLVPLGLKVGQNEVRRKIGFSKPEDGEDILVPPRADARPNGSENGIDENDDGIPPKKQTARACPRCGKVHLASEQTEELTANEILAEEGAGRWEADMGPIVQQILATADDASGYEEFVARLNAMNPATSQLARSLAIQAMKARGDGDIGDE